MTSEKINLLVLGVGGNVSQGILKSLAASSLNCHVIGGCISAHSMGLYTCDHAVISPLASDPHFVDWLVETCREHGVAGVLSGVEPVLRVLAQRQSEIESRTDARLIVSPPSKWAICADKLQTAQWLREHQLNYPRSSDARDETQVRRLVGECGFPLLAKPRDARGSQGIMRIASEADLAAAMQQPNYVIQEDLGHPTHEYTAATFTDRDGGVRGCIVLERQLHEGTTVIAQVVDALTVRAEVLAIAEALRPVGPCNMQLRLVNNRPVCFEINLRYSGTAPIRAHFGFNDVEAGVRHYVLGEPAYDLPDVRHGTALRFWNEIYVDQTAIESCSRSGALSDPQRAIKHSELFGRGT